MRIFHCLSSTTQLQVPEQSINFKFKLLWEVVDYLELAAVDSKCARTPWPKDVRESTHLLLLSASCDLASGLVPRQTNKRSQGPRTFLAWAYDTGSKLQGWNPRVQLYCLYQKHKSTLHKWTKWPPSSDIIILDIASFHHFKRKEASDLAGRTQAVPYLNRQKLFRVSQTTLQVHTTGERAPPQRQVNELLPGTAPINMRKQISSTGGFESVDRDIFACKETSLDKSYRRLNLEHEAFKFSTTYSRRKRM